MVVVRAVHFRILNCFVFVVDTVHFDMEAVKMALGLEPLLFQVVEVVVEDHFGGARGHCQATVPFE